MEPAALESELGSRSILIKPEDPQAMADDLWASHVLSGLLQVIPQGEWLAASAWHQDRLPQHLLFVALADFARAACDSRSKQ